MPVAFNHTMVHCRDAQESATFFSEITGLVDQHDPSGHVLELITVPYGG